MSTALRFIVVAIAITIGPHPASAYSTAQQASIYAFVLAQFAGANCPLSITVEKEVYAEMAESGLNPDAGLTPEFKNASLTALADISAKFQRGQDALCAYAWKQLGPAGEYKRQMLQAKYPHGTGPVALELQDTKVVQNSHSTEINMQFLSRRFLAQPAKFLRLRCEVFDVGGTSLGIFSKDFSSRSRMQTVSILPRSYWRPSLRVGHIEGADHASCRFANNDDPSPTVSVDDVELELPNTNSVRTTNRSAYHLASVAFTCVGPDEAGGRTGELSTSYNNSQSLGIAPGESMDPQYIKYFARRCFVTAVKVAPPPDMRPDMDPNKPHL